jgi:hypothetical protein
MHARLWLIAFLPEGRFYSFGQVSAQLQNNKDKEKVVEDC